MPAQVARAHRAHRLQLRCPDLARCCPRGSRSARPKHRRQGHRQHCPPRGTMKYRSTARVAGAGCGKNGDSRFANVVQRSRPHPARFCLRQERCRRPTGAADQEKPQTHWPCCRDRGPLSFGNCGQPSVSRRPPQTRSKLQSGRRENWRKTSSTPKRRPPSGKSPHGTTKPGS